MVGEPKRHQSHAYDLRDETLDVTVAVASLHIQTDVSVFARFIFALLVVTHFGYR